MKRTVNWLTERYLYAYQDCFAVERVEKQQGPVRFDCFGFADFVGISDSGAADVPSRVLWVQSTSVSNISSRLTKVKENKTAQRLTDVGHEVLVFGWKNLGEGIYLLNRSRLVKVNNHEEYRYDSIQTNIGEEDLIPN